MSETNDFNAFIIELIDFRLHKVKHAYEVKFSIADTYSGDFTKNLYRYFTNNSRSSDEFLFEFLNEVNRRVGEYIFKIDEKGLFYIEDRHVLLFNVRPYKRINVNIKRMYYLLIEKQKCMKLREGGTKLVSNDTHLYLTQGHLLISPISRSELTMAWYNKYTATRDYNLVQL